MANNNYNRYSEQDLEEFRILISRKLEKAIRELELTLSQIEDSNESKGRSADWVDDTMNGHNYEFLQTMAIRQRKHIRDLENAMLRIHNRTYGICVITGERIDKRRLLAVPATTKSLSAKLTPVVQPKTKAPIIKPEDFKPRIVSKIVKPQNKLRKSLEDLFCLICCLKIIQLSSLLFLLVVVSPNEFSQLQCLDESSLRLHHPVD